MTLIYPQDSIGISCPIQINGQTITTSYSPDALMSNTAAGFGKAWFSVFDSTGAIVRDAANNLLQDVVMYRDHTTDGVAVFTIGPGLTTPGTYSIQPFYGVDTTGGPLNWRKQTAIPLTITPLPYSTDVPA